MSSTPIHEWRLFRRTTLRFGWPFAALALLLVAVDPYNYFGVSRVFPEAAKLAVSYKLNYALWKLVRYDRAPAPNLLLGDSRMNLLTPALVREASGLDYANLSYGAGTLPEMCQTFWHATERTSLSNVYMGVGFSLYNLANSSDRVSGVRAVLRNPLLYLVNRNAWQAAIRLMRGQGRTGAGALDRPSMSPEDFWNHQLTETTRRYYGHYVYPESFRQELERIAAWCRAHKVKLVFVVLPNHTDLQDQVAAYGLEDAHRRFLADLHALGTVLDFDQPSDLTRARENFNDPYHFTPAIARQLVRAIWSPDPTSP